MALEFYINYNGNCREAVEYYAKIFEQDVPQMMTFGDIPPVEGDTKPDDYMEITDENRHLIMHTELKIGGSRVMFSDVPAEMPFTAGNNISITYITESKEEITKYFNAIKESGGTVMMELQWTFWSGWYGMVTDKFGIGWQFSHDNGKECGE